MSSPMSTLFGSSVSIDRRPWYTASLPRTGAKSGADHSTGPDTVGSAEYAQSGAASAAKTASSISRSTSATSDSTS